MTIRDATIDDSPALSRLMTELGYPTTEPAMRARLEAIAPDPSYATYVAVDDDVVVGAAGVRLGRYYEKDGMYAHLVVLVVSSDCRGRGVGSQLTDAVECWSLAHGARDIVVTSALRRHEAHAFYERRGYARTGFRFVKPLSANG
jgi:GNAT superfamily N-acetyltransferase